VDGRERGWGVAGGGEVRGDDPAAAAAAAVTKLFLLKKIDGDAALQWLESRLDEADMMWCPAQKMTGRDDGDVPEDEGEEDEEEEVEEEEEEEEEGTRKTKKKNNHGTKAERQESFELIGYDEDEDAYLRAPPMRSLLKALGCIPPAQTKRGPGGGGGGGDKSDETVVEGNHEEEYWRLPGTGGLEWLRKVRANLRIARAEGERMKADALLEQGEQRHRENHRGKWKKPTRTKRNHQAVDTDDEDGDDEMDHENLTESDDDDDQGSARKKKKKTNNNNNNNTTTTTTTIIPAISGAPEHDMDEDGEEGGHNNEEEQEEQEEGGGGGGWLGGGWAAAPTQVDHDHADDDKENNEDEMAIDKDSEALTGSRSVEPPVVVVVARQ